LASSEEEILNNIEQMKKILFVSFCMMIMQVTNAQNEGRISVFSGVSKTTLSHQEDAAFGDMQPTYKPMIGIEAAYHYTLFKALPMGISLQLAHQQTGQNYRGAYDTPTNYAYYAYTRLSYLRSGLALHFGTNPRKQVAFTFSAGANVGFLTNYHERYEVLRNNDDRYVIDIKNKEFSLNDTSKVTGTLTKALYNPTDMAAFGTFGMDFLLSTNWVFGFYGRIDYGFSSVDSREKIMVNFDTKPSSSAPLKWFNSKVKYQGPVNDGILRSMTTNMGYGLFLTLRYRIYNKEKIEFHYRENRDYNHQ
jgi:hypothetical protein